MEYPIYVKNCIDRLAESGFSAYAVGGAVRDSLLGREPYDWDVATDALPEEVMNIFSDRRVIPTGIRHGTVTVLFDGGGIEITTFRIDGEYADFRHPSGVSFSKSIGDDLSRRDFTVNAIAFSEREGIIDPYGGISDLEARLLRTVGDAQTRFCEDALRILRAFRFCASLEFEIEEKTYAAACRCAKLLRGIARERIGAELERTLSSPGAARALSLMRDGGVLAEIFPETSISLSDETILSLNLAEPRFTGARTALLLESLSREEAESLLESLRLSNAKKKFVLRLCGVKKFLSECADEACEVRARRFLHLYGDIADEAVALLPALLSEDEDEALSRAISDEKNARTALSVRDLRVSGKELAALCDELGALHSEIGALNEALLELVLVDPSKNEREELLKISKKLLNGRKIQ